MLLQSLSSWLVSSKRRRRRALFPLVALSTECDSVVDVAEPFSTKALARRTKTKLVRMIAMVCRVERNIFNEGFAGSLNR
ncbi:hypothetical protein PsorP6_014961 [Peronosclerospora sorghi]|uniref:Uncharacterized protein n=1 Tax=Peronosclerospora sorghi TaxID=230839 RepID=A0ACC0VSR5_9STRA|nr:hypothetical protein PsorP6_014961 [Peronosclerospora sorghi]